MQSVTVPLSSSGVREGECACVCVYAYCGHGRKTNWRVLRHRRETTLQARLAETHTLQHTATHRMAFLCNAAEVCCSVLLCVAACWSVLQCVAVSGFAYLCRVLFRKRGQQLVADSCKETCKISPSMLLCHPRLVCARKKKYIQHTLQARWTNVMRRWRQYIATTAHCNTLQHTATHCNTLQHTAAHCNTLQHTVAHCNTLQHTAAHCNTL